MDPIAVAIALDRHHLPVTGGQRFLQLRLRAAEAPSSATRKPLNLAFVLDRSGSMAGDKLRLVKEAVTFGIGQLTSRDHAAVVVYDHQVQTLAASTPVTGEAKAQIGLALGAVQEGGSTALGEGWLTGCRLAAEAAARLGEGWRTRSLLLTDGLANVGVTDPAELVGHATALRRRGVTTSTFGVGADFDEQLLNSLAEAGGGNFYFIEHAAQLPAFFAGELGDLLTVVAERTTLTLTLPAGLDAELLNDYTVERDGATLTVEIGDISAGEEKVVVFALTGAPATAAGQELPVTATLRYRHGADSGEMAVTAPPAALRYVSEAAAEAEAPDAQVIAAAGRLQAARAKREALEHTYAGRYADAEAVLSSTASYMRAPAMAAAAPALAEDAAELQALSTAARAGFDSLTRKRMSYTQKVVGQSRRDHGQGTQQP